MDGRRVFHARSSSQAIVEGLVRRVERGSCASLHVCPLSEWSDGQLLAILVWTAPPQYGLCILHSAVCSLQFAACSSL